MMTGLRRIVVTALLGVFVSLGVIKALFGGRHPRPRLPRSAEELVPVVNASPAIPPRRPRRRFAVGLVVLLMLIGLIGVIHENRGTIIGPVPSETDSAGAPRTPLRADIDAPSSETPKADTPDHPPAAGRDDGNASRTPSRDDAAASVQGKANPSVTLQAPKDGTGAVRADTGAAGIPAPKVGPSEGSPTAGGSARDAGASPAGAQAKDGPRFDVVRVEPNGEVVVAGRGQPNATVDLLVDGKPVARATTGSDGQFTLTPPPLPTGSSEIALSTTDARGVKRRSPASVAVVVAPSRNTKPLIALTSPNKPTVVLSQPEPPAAAHSDTALVHPQQAPLAADDTVGTVGPRQAPADAPRGGAGQEHPGSTPLGLRPSAGGDADGTRPAPKVPAGVAQPGDGAVSGAEAPPLKIVSIDAQDGGRLFVTARAAAGSSLRLYLNDTLIAPATVARDGTATFTISKGVRPGDYRVRLDLVDPVTGKVRDRVEVPFTAPGRGHDEGVEYSAKPEQSEPATSATSVAEAPPTVDHKAPQDPPHAGAEPAPAPAGPSEIYVPGIETARIERGDSLWKISRRTYGEGERYTLIFDANQDQIKNPDLIYPGQVLVLPDADNSKTGSDDQSN
jgi:nucleoid-associated protein YgaU